MPKLERYQILNHFTYYERFFGFLEMVSKNKFKVQVRILFPQGFILCQLFKIEQTADTFMVRTFFFVIN